MFQIRSPYLTSLPPLYTNMPLDVLIAYIGVDSIARNVNHLPLQSFFNSISSFNDTLKQYGKYLYRAIDWNPFLFQQYSNETQFRQIGPPPNEGLHFVDSNGAIADTALGAPAGLYKVGLPFNRTRIAGLYLRYLPDSLPETSMTALLGADYILRVAIDSVDSCRNYLTPEPNAQRFAVYARVLDTLKGRVFPNLCQNANRYMMPFQSELQGKNNPQVPQSASGPCNEIRFEMSKGTYRSGNWAVVGRDFIRDTAFLDQSQNFVMHPGTECIVFLSFRNHLVDDDYDYYNLDVNSNLSYGVLRIHDGKVIDLNHVWSPTELTLPQFMQRFEHLVNVMTNP